MASLVAAGAVSDAARILKSADVTGLRQIRGGSFARGIETKIVFVTKNARHAIASPDRSVDRARRADSRYRCRMLTRKSSRCRLAEELSDADGATPAHVHDPCPMPSPIISDSHSFPPCSGRRRADRVPVFEHRRIARDRIHEADAAFDGAIAINFRVASVGPERIRLRGKMHSSRPQE